MKVNKIEECFRVINVKEKSLAAYVFTNDKKLKDEFTRNVAAGGMAINDTVLHFVEPGLPFGGVWESGMGTYHGKYSFDAFSHKKAVLKRGFDEFWSQIMNNLALNATLSSIINTCHLGAFFNDACKESDNSGQVIILTTCSREETFLDGVFFKHGLCEAAELRISLFHNFIK
ncbi:hypothetical protein OROMI_032050 [Orobanche minor]